jgi:hypothetical protein
MLQGSSGKVFTWWYRIRTVCRMLWTGQLILKLKKGPRTDSELLKQDAAPLDCFSRSSCACWPVQIQRLLKTIIPNFRILFMKHLARGGGGGGGPSESLYTTRTAKTTRMQMYIHVSSGLFFICSYLVLHCSGIELSMVVCIVSYCMLWIFPSGMRIHYPRFRTTENNMHFRPRGYCGPTDYLVTITIITLVTCPWSNY